MTRGCGAARETVQHHRSMATVARGSAYTFSMLMLCAVACSDGAPKTEPPNDASPPVADASEDDAWTVRPDAAAKVTHASCMAEARRGDVDACDECCTKAFPEGWRTTWDSLRACACRKAKPTCTAECGPEYCAGTLRPEDSTLACTTCVSDSWADVNYDCVEAFAATCRRDNACMDFFGCLDDCEMTASDAGAPDAK